MKNNLAFSKKIAATMSLSFMLIACFMVSNARADVRFGKADVKIKNNTPCFTVTDNEFRRADGKINFSGYAVYDKTSELWGYSLNKSYIRLLPGACLVYGVLPESEVMARKAGEVIPSTAPPLQLNTVYSLEFNASAAKRDSTAAYYMRDFCLQKEASGKLIVQHVLGSCENVIPPEAPAIYTKVRFGKADVKIKNNTPCFTVTDKEFKRADGKIKFSGYAVYDKTGPLWGYKLKESYTLLLPGACLVYGVLPEGGEIPRTAEDVIPSTAPPLQLNTSYILQFIATPAKKDSTAVYVRNFCLQKEASGKLIAQHVFLSCKNVIPPEAPPIDMSGDFEE